MPTTDADTDTHQRKICYVLPVYNEAGSLEVFHRTLVEALAARPDLDIEFIYVNDGSRDDSLEILLGLREHDPRVSVLSLSRNHGHQLALTAGMDAAQAAEPDAVVLMDTDLQDPPTVSVQLIERWEEGADVVYAQRRTRRDTPFKRLSAALFYRMLERISETRIPPDVGDFRVLDRRVLDAVVAHREHNRFLRGIVASVGYQQETLLFDRDARYAGSTGYSLRRMLRLAGDGIFGFSTWPLQLITRVGLVISLLSLVAAVYAIVIRLGFSDRAVPGWAFLGVGMFFLGGVQLIMLGVIGSYVGRTYIEVLNRPLYHLAVVARGIPDAAPPPR